MKDPVGRFTALLRGELLLFLNEFFGNNRDDIEPTMRALNARIDKATAQLNRELDLQPRQLYELVSRNLLIGAYVGNGEFIGIREKCGTYRLDVEGNVQQATPIHVAVPPEIACDAAVVSAQGRSDDYRTLFDYLAKIDGARTGRTLVLGATLGEYEVVVGNIGRVYLGDSEDEARAMYDSYVTASTTGEGRASNEQVVLLRDGEPIDQYIPLTEEVP